MTPQKILSTCVSRAKPVTHQGEDFLTGIFKEPVQGRLTLSFQNLEGDEQADLTVHGGVDKAIYAYPSEHYEFWRQELPDIDFQWGAFGENLVTQGLLEGEVYIGDEFRVGSAIIRVSQPRLPCFKLAMKFGRPEIIKRFMQSGRSGIYFSVVEEGSLESGDELVYMRGDEHHISVLEVAQVFTNKDMDRSRIDKIMQSNLAAQMKTSVTNTVSKRK